MNTARIKRVGNVGLVTLMMVCGSAGFASGQTLTVLPDLPLVSPGGQDGIDPIVTVHSSTNFTVSYDLSGAAEYQFAMVHHPTWDAWDVSAITQFVFGVKGDPDQIKVEFVDKSDSKTTINSPTLTDEFQFWTIPASTVNNADLSTIHVISFVIDEGLAGVGNTVGEFTVFVDGLEYEAPPPDPVDLDPSDPLDTDITVLPGDPLVNDLDGTLFMQHSSSNFTVSYSLPDEEDWDGVMVRWENFDPMDLTAIAEFVFGVLGTPEAIKVEFEDNAGGKTIFNLNGVTDTLQHWHIDASLIDNLDDIKVISFVVDRALAGEGNEDGHYTVFVGGLSYESSVAAIESSDPGLLPITILPDTPMISDLAGTLFEQHSSTNFTVLYDLDAAAEEWEGVMVHRDGFAPMNLTAIDTFVIGVTGTPNAVKVEFKDLSGAVTTFFLNGVSAPLQHWHIHAALIPNLAEIELIAFVVDYGLAGGGNEAGAFTVFIGGLGFEDEDPEEPAFDNFSVTDAGGIPQATVNLGVGVDQTTYTLYFTTDLTADPVDWEVAHQVIGNGVSEVTLTDDDAENDDAMRMYRFGVD